MRLSKVQRRFHKDERCHAGIKNDELCDEATGEWPMVLGDSGEEAQDQQKQHNSLIDSSAITMSSRTNH